MNTAAERGGEWRRGGLLGRRAGAVGAASLALLLALGGCVDVGVEPRSEPCDCAAAADCDDVGDAGGVAPCEGEAPAASAQDGVCEGAAQICRDGAWVEDLSVVPGWQETERSCDGLDNDCDGATDEDLGETTCGRGACEHTAPDCVDGGRAVCDPYEGATAETCNGVDDDCDGATDEDAAAPLADDQDGVCFDARKTCGGADGWQEPDYTTVRDHEAPEATCDDKDNDCDGTTDEDDVCAAAGSK